MERRVQSKKRYFLAFGIATVIFLLGFLITYGIAYLEFQRISSQQTELSYGIFQDKLKHSFFEETLCEETTYKDVSEELSFQGRIIDDLEKKFGKQDQKVLLRKKFYTLVELEHLEFVKQLEKNCNKTINTILFFYSNNENEIEKSEELGRLISSVAEQNENLVVYSFDINLDSELINLIKETYQIDKPQTLIVNDAKVFSPDKAEDINKYLLKE